MYAFTFITEVQKACEDRLGCCNLLSCFNRELTTWINQLFITLVFLSNSQIFCYHWLFVIINIISLYCNENKATPWNRMFSTQRIYVFTNKDKESVLKDHLF